MGETAGTKEAPQSVRPDRLPERLRRHCHREVTALWGFVMSVYQHPATRWVVLVLLTMFQVGFLWLLGQMVELCISLMELWVELAAKHLEITLDTT